MKRSLLLRCLVAWALAALGPSRLDAVVVSYTFSGVTTTNFVEANSTLNAELPVGRAWTAVVQWETAAAPLYSDATQAQFPTVSMTLTIQGINGPWTTSTLSGQPTYTQNYTFGNTRDEIQFTSGWGPAAHTNQTIFDFQPYSINLVLVDLTGTAIPSLTPAPTFLDLNDWTQNVANTQLKFYLNNNANRYLLGNIQSIAVTAVPEPSTYAALVGAAALGLATWHRRRRLPASTAT